MTDKYDWDVIRVRYARGETCHAISKSMDGKPTRQGIMKRAKRENWLEGNSEIPASIKNLSLVQTGSKLPRKRSPEAVNAVLGFIDQGATEEMAARAAGIHPKTLYNWKLECPEFAAMIAVARARKQVEWVNNIDRAGKKDWKASDRLLQADPDTREIFGRQVKQEGPKIILNIHRDEVVIDQRQNEPIEVTPERRIETSPDTALEETTDEETADKDTPELVDPLDRW